MQVFVSGAGGFLGARVVAALSKDPQASVRAGVTRSALQGDGVATTVCDLLSQPSTARAVEGAEAIVHCAVGAGRDERVTVEGTRNLLDAARGAGVRRFVFVSSAAVYGAVTGVVTENHDVTPPTDAYGSHKREAEDLCRTAAQQGMDVAILRPSLIYGPNGRQWSVAFIRRLASGQWPRLGEAGSGKCNLVFVDDVAAAAAALARAAPKGLSVFNLNGPDVPTWDAYLETLNQALGLPPLRASDTPIGLMAARARIRRSALKLVARAVGRLPFASGLAEAADQAQALPPSDAEVADFAKDVLYDASRARAAGIGPSTQLEAGIADTASWARRSGLLAGR